MSDGGENTPSAPPTLPASDRLDSWKEIAAYLRRGVSTVQRWEKEEGLPTHRLHHSKQGSVYGFKSELDAWVRDRRERIEANDEAEVGRSPSPRDASKEISAPAKSTPTEERPDAPVPAPPGPAAPAAPGGPAVRSAGGAALLAAVWTDLAPRQSQGPHRPAPGRAASPGPPPAVPVTSSRDSSVIRVSPDGHRLAYVSNERLEIHRHLRPLREGTSTRRGAAASPRARSPNAVPPGHPMGNLRFPAAPENRAVVLTIPATGGQAVDPGDDHSLVRVQP